MAGFGEEYTPDAYEARGSLLYIGALYDAYPLTLPDVRRKHGCLLFTDAMPANSYYRNITTEQQILQILLDEGGRFGIVSDFTMNERDGSFECMLRDDCKLKYFFNTNDLDRLKLNQGLLNTVKTLWCHGYEPQGDVVSLLPSLSFVYGSPSSMGEAYWAARAKMGTVGDDNLQEFNVKCSIPDVICWQDEGGFDLRGDEGQDERLLASDAPFTFTAAGDEEEDEGEEEEEGEGEGGEEG